jgi:hypothetical protein
VTEFTGTFGLVFTVGAAVMSKAALAALAARTPRSTSLRRTRWMKSLVVVETEGTYRNDLSHM